MTTPYVYKLTDKLTGKRYLGVRLAFGCDPSDLGVTYFTSSKIVKPLFQSDPSRFDKQIIVTGDKDYVINVEKSLISFYNAVLSDDFYNRANAKAVHPEDKGIGERSGQHDVSGECENRRFYGKCELWRLVARRLLWFRGVMFLFRHASSFVFCLY